MPLTPDRRPDVPTPFSAARLAAVLVLALAVGLALAAPAQAARPADGAAQVSTHFALLAAFPGPAVGTEGVLVVPGTVLPLEGHNRGGSGEEQAAEVTELARRLLHTLRLKDMKVLYTYPVVTRVGETMELPPPTATSPLRVSVELQGYNPELATYRVRFREGAKTFTDSVVSVARGKRAVVGGLDGDEAPYLFLVVSPASVADDADGGPRFVGDDITPPRRLSGEAPKYTEEGRKERVQGVVILRAVIDRTGAVTDVETLKGLPFGLTGAAEEAIRTWRFEPARDADGVPIDVFYNLTINFRLEEKLDEAGAAESGGAG